MKKCETCGKESYMFSWESECFSCRKKRNAREIRQQIEDGEIIEVDCEEEVFCPYCGLDHDVDFENDELYVEGECEFTCAECEKDFLVDVHVSYSYSTRRKEE